MFQNLTCCKNSDSKNDELFKVDRKSDIFWNSWFKVWRVVENLFQNLFLFWKSWFKKCFFSFFLYIRVFEKSQNWRSWRLCGIEGSKIVFLQANQSSKYLFIQSSSLQNVISCKTFFRNLTHSKNFYSKLSSWKKNWL